jgi:hypothetical protein
MDLEDDTATDADDEAEEAEEVADPGTAALLCDFWGVIEPLAASSPSSPPPICVSINPASSSSNGVALPRRKATSFNSSAFDAADD